MINMINMNTSLYCRYMLYVYVYYIAITKAVDGVSSPSLADDRFGTAPIAVQLLITVANIMTQITYYII